MGKSKKEAVKPQNMDWGEGVGGEQWGDPYRELGNREFS